MFVDKEFKDYLRSIKWDWPENAEAQLVDLINRFSVDESEPCPHNECEFTKDNYLTCKFCGQKFTKVN